MELDRIIDAKPYQNRERSYYRHVYPDAGKAHQTEGCHKADPHQEDRHKPVPDIGKQNPHNNDHQDHSPANEDAHVTPHPFTHLLHKRR